MKIFKKIVLAFALVLAICLPIVLLTACGDEEKLSLVQTFKTEYYVGETLDVSGGILKYIDADGKATSVEIQENMVSVFSTEKPGSKKMLITYKDETLTVNYIVKPWDVQDNVYYFDDNTGLFLLFNRAQNKVTMFNNLSSSDPDQVPDYEKKTFKMNKGFDEDGNIVYTYQVPTGQGADQNTSVTYTISNITKESIKMSAANQVVTLTIFS